MSSMALMPGGVMPARYRVQYKFWLDQNKDTDLELCDYCEMLKNQRSFAASIRDGLRLIRDLRNHKLGVLFELFPWVNDWLENRAHAIANGNTDIKALRQQIEQLERALIHERMAPTRQHIPDDMPDTLPEFEIKVGKSDKIPAYEVMISGAMLARKFHKLPPEVMAYGIKRGRIPAEAMPAATPDTSVTAPKANRFSWNKK